MKIDSLVAGRGEREREKEGSCGRLTPWQVQQVRVGVVFSLYLAIQLRCTYVSAYLRICICSLSRVSISQRMFYACLLIVIVLPASASRFTFLFLSVALLMLYTYIICAYLGHYVTAHSHTHRQLYIRVYLRIYHFTCTLCLLYSTRQSILMGQELGKFNCHIEILMHNKYRDIFSNDSLRELHYRLFQFPLLLLRSLFAFWLILSAQ